MPTWTGNISRRMNSYVPGAPAIAPYAVAVSNTAGQWLFALISWRQDNGSGGGPSYNATVNVSDDAGNFWIPVCSGQPDVGAVRCTIWMAPAARPAQYVYVSPTAFQGALTIMITEFGAEVPWYQIAAVTATAVNSGTSTTLSQDPPSGLLTLGLLCWDLVAASPTITASGWTSLGSVTTDNGVDTSGDLVQQAYFASTTGSTMTISASDASGIDWAQVLITVHGVDDAIAFPYGRLPLENWPALVTEIGIGATVNANPECNSLTYWAGNGGTAAVASWPLWNPWPSYQLTLSGSIQLTPSGSSSGSSVSSEQEAVSPVIQYDCVAFVWSALGWAGGLVYPQIDWFDSTDTYIFTSSGTGVTLQAGSWTQMSFPAPLFPPANAAFADAKVGMVATSGNVPASAVIYVGFCALSVADSYENAPPDQVYWTDISSWHYSAQSAKIARGIQYEQQSLEAGTLEATLRNDIGEWTPGNISSAFYPGEGDTDVPLRLRAVWPGSITPYYPLFTGYTDDITFGWEDETWYPYAQTTASDCWSRLTQQMLQCFIQEVLQDNPAGFWTTSLEGANSIQNGYPVAGLAGPEGSAGATQTSQGSLFTNLPGAQGLSNWQSSGASSGGNIGYALGYFPPTVVTVSAGCTVEFWHTPVSATQPTSPLVICTAWARKGPMWTLWIDFTNGVANSYAWITVYDKSTGAATSTRISTAIQFLSPAGALTYWAVRFGQSSLTVTANPGGSPTETQTVSCNLNAWCTGFSWGGNAGPVGSQITGGTGPVTSFGIMNCGVFGISLFTSEVPPTRTGAHYQAALTAFAGELDTWRVARICGYSGFVPPLAMRCTELNAVPAADLDLVTGATDTDSQVVSAYLTNIASSTLAAMFVNGAGSLVYRRRIEWYDRAQPQWAAGDSPPVNLLLNPLNATASTAEWVTNDGATLTTSELAAAGPLFVPYCGLFTGNGATANPNIFYSNGGAGAAVTQGLYYAMSAWLYCPQGWSGGVQAEIQFYTSVGGFISGETTTLSALAAGSLTFLYCPQVRAPDNAAIGALLIQANGTPASTVQFYVAAVWLWQQPYVAAGGALASAPEVPYLPDVKLSSDRAVLYNQAILNQYGTDLTSKFSGTDVVFTPSSGVVVIISNTASEALRGSVPYTVTLYTYNTAQALPYYLNEPSMEDFGWWIVNTLGQPLFRPMTVTFTPVASGASPGAVALGMQGDVGDTDTFRRRPFGAPEMQVLTYVSHLEADISTTDGKFDVKHELSPYQQGTVLACDDVVHGCLTGGNLLGW